MNHGLLCDCARNTASKVKLIRILALCTLPASDERRPGRPRRCCSERRRTGLGQPLLDNAAETGRSLENERVPQGGVNQSVGRELLEAIRSKIWAFAQGAERFKEAKVTPDPGGVLK